jgi:hypothetical protein
MANKNQYKAQDFIEAIPGTGGIVVRIAQKVGCDWNTAKKYITEFATVRAAYEQEKHAMDDLAENTVLQAIKDGDVNTAKWWLRVKRRDEFGDNLDVTSGGKDLVIKVTVNDDTDSSTD